MTNNQKVHIVWKFLFYNPKIKDDLRGKLLDISYNAKMAIATEDAYRIGGPGCREWHEARQAERKRIYKAYLKSKAA